MESPLLVTCSSNGESEFEGLETGVEDGEALIMVLQSSWSWFPAMCRWWSAQWWCSQGQLTASDRSEGEDCGNELN